MPAFAGMTSYREKAAQRAAFDIQTLDPAFAGVTTFFESPLRGDDMQGLLLPRVQQKSVAPVRRRECPPDIHDNTASPRLRGHDGI